MWKMKRNKKELKLMKNKRKKKKHSFFLFITISFFSENHRDEFWVISSPCFSFILSQFILFISSQLLSLLSSPGWNGKGHSFFVRRSVLRGLHLWFKFIISAKDSWVFVFSVFQIAEVLDGLVLIRNFHECM